MRDRNNLSESECLINMSERRVQGNCSEFAALCVLAGVPVSARRSLQCCSSFVAGHKLVAGMRLVEGNRNWPLQPVVSPWLVAPLAFLL